MNNEHVEDIAETSEELVVDDAGPTVDSGEHGVEHGPLDPSVFFGLFDDLDGSDDEVELPAEDAAKAPDANRATAEPDTTVTDPAAADAVVDAAVADPGADTIAPSIPPESDAPINLFGPYPAAEDQGPEHTSVGQPQGNGNAANGAGQLGQLETQPSNGVSSTAGQAVLASPPKITTPKPVVATTPKPVDPAPTITIPVQSERAGGAMATAALITIAVGLFGGLIVAFVLSLRSPDVVPNVDEAANATEDGIPASSTIVAELGLANVADELNQGTVNEQQMAQLITAESIRRLQESRLDVTGLAFDPGTTKLGESSQELVAVLGDGLAGSDGVPLTALVRTYSEPTAGENLSLSRLQAQSLVDALVAAGAAPDQVRAVGLGSSPLSPALPVPDFVEITPGFGQHTISKVVDDAEPFAVGNPMAERPLASPWVLRIESLAPLADIGRALQGTDDSSVGMAGYSYLAATDERNQAIAAATTETAARFLSDSFAIDPGRVAIITPGPAPYVPSPDIGNLIWVAAGPESQAGFDLAGINVDAISFSEASISPDAETILTEIGTIFAGSQASIVIDVRSYERGSDSADLELSQARADALRTALEQTGIGAGQIRTFASGASSSFSETGPMVTITVIP